MLSTSQYVLLLSNNNVAEDRYSSKIQILVILRSLSFEHFLFGDQQYMLGSAKLWHHDMYCLLSNNNIAEDPLYKLLGKIEFAYLLIWRSTVHIVKPKRNAKHSALVSQYVLLISNIIIKQKILVKVIGWSSAYQKLERYLFGFTSCTLIQSWKIHPRSR